MLKRIIEWDVKRINEWKALEKEINHLNNYENPMNFKAIFNNPNEHPSLGEIMFIGLSVDSKYRGQPDRTCWRIYPRTKAVWGRRYHELAMSLLKNLYPNKNPTYTFSEYFWNTNVVKSDAHELNYRKDTPLLQKWLNILFEEIRIVDPKIIVLFGGRVVDAVRNEKELVSWRKGEIGKSYLGNDDRSYIFSYSPAARNHRKNKMEGNPFSNTISDVVNSILEKYNQ